MSESKSERRRPSLAELLEQAADLRPAELGVVEPELRGPAPRRNVWVQTSKLDAPAAEVAVFREWRAQRGWLCYFHQEPAHEGPDYDLAFGYDTKAGIKIVTAELGYDSAHWAIGARAFYQWFHNTMKLGQPATVLIAPDKQPKGSGAMIYGLQEPYIRISAGDVLESMKTETNKDHRDGAIDCLDEILHQLAFHQPERLAALVRKMGRYATGLVGRPPHDIANELMRRLLRDDLRMPGLDIMIGELSDQSRVRFAAL